ncbi:MAG: hypothetical protein HY561_06580 [Gemmatimonadetes bacterium]|nr:hypothetical protein [Gemmatimonadota bacterium]
MTKRFATDLAEALKRLAADYPDAPADLDEYFWLSVPKYWECVTVPIIGRDVRIAPRHEDRHGGVGFKVGWNVEERVAALWIL